jgi:hypothetical protein
MPRLGRHRRSRHARHAAEASGEPRPERKARAEREPRSASGERAGPTGNLGATVKAWLGVIDEVLRTVETTAYQARNVAEQARGAYVKTRESVDELEDLLRDAAARATR